MAVVINELTDRQRELIACALDAAADALASREWADLPGATVAGTGDGVAPLLVHLATQISRSTRVVIYTDYSA